MKNKIIFLISILTFLIISSISTSASEKIKIGLLLPLSGENKNIGTSVLRSVSMAVNKIDSSKIEILPKNNFDNPEKNYIAAKELYDNGVRIFIGPIFEKNIKNLSKLDDAIFLSFTNKLEKKSNNIISVGVNALSQLEAIEKFQKIEGLDKTICLIPEDRFRDEIEKGLSSTNIKLKKKYFYESDPTLLTKRIEKITKYDRRKQNLADEIKRVEESDEFNKEKIIENLEKKDTLGKVNFDSVIISAFDETLKSITTSLIYTDVTPKKTYFITLNQWFDESLLNEDSSQNLYFPSVNKNNFDEFKQEYFKKYSSEPNQISLLGFDMVGLIFYLSKVNNFQLNNKIFDQRNTFKGKIGLFEIEDKRIKHVLNFYKVENNKFKKIF